MDHTHTFLTTQGHGGPPRMSDQHRPYYYVLYFPTFKTLYWSALLLSSIIVIKCITITFARIYVYYFIYSVPAVQPGGPGSIPGRDKFPG